MPGYGDDCYPMEWPATLDLVISMLTDSSVVVPGHGLPVDKDFVQEQRSAIGVVAETIRDLASRGVRVDDALAAAEWPYPAEELAQAVRAATQLPRLGAAPLTGPVAAPAGERAATQPDDQEPASTAREPSRKTATRARITQRDARHPTERRVRRSAAPGVAERVRRRGAAGRGRRGAAAGQVGEQRPQRGGGARRPGTIRRSSYSSLVSRPAA